MAYGPIGVIDSGYPEWEYHRLHPVQWASRLPMPGGCRDAVVFNHACKHPDGFKTDAM